MDTLHRWQDRLEVGIGVWLCLSPWVLELPQSAAWCAAVVGVGVIVLASEEQFWPSQIDAWGNTLLGIALMISPWVLSYADDQYAMLNALVMGLLVTLMSGWALERVLYAKFKLHRANSHAHN